MTIAAARLPFSASTATTKQPSREPIAARVTDGAAMPGGSIPFKGDGYLTKVTDGAAMPGGKVISLDGQPVRASPPQRLSGVSVCTSTFIPAAPRGAPAHGRINLHDPFAPMHRSTPELREQVVKTGNQLVRAILRGDSGRIAQLQARLADINGALNARAVPSAVTDMMSSFRYAKGLKRMSNEELTTEFSLQSGRVFAAQARGDTAGVAAAKTKLEACGVELQGRAEAALAEYMAGLEGMTDEQVVEAHEAEVDGSAEPAVTTGQREEAVPANDNADDIGKLVASAAEMFKRGLEEQLTAPFKFLGNLFGG